MSVPSGIDVRPRDVVMWAFDRNQIACAGTVVSLNFNCIDDQRWDQNPWDRLSTIVFQGAILSRYLPRAEAVLCRVQTSIFHSTRCVTSRYSAPSKVSLTALGQPSNGSCSLESSLTAYLGSWRRTAEAASRCDRGGALTGSASTSGPRGPRDQDRVRAIPQRLDYTGRAQWRGDEWVGGDP